MHGWHNSFGGNSKICTAFHMFRRNYPRPTIHTCVSTLLLHLWTFDHFTVSFTHEIGEERSGRCLRRHLQAFIRHQLPAAHQHSDIGCRALNFALAPAAGAGPKGMAAGHPAANPPPW